MYYLMCGFERWPYRQAANLWRCTVLCILMLGLMGCDKSKTSAIEWIHLSSAQSDIPSPGPSTQQTASLVLDVDKDGLNDFIIGSRVTGPSVLWYRRNPWGWTKYVIDNAFLPIEAGGAFYDIDNDGNLDIVFGGDSQSNKIWWWENPFPYYDPAIPWKRREIKSSGANKHHDEMFGDFDGDGQAEFVFWNQGAKTLFLADIPADPKNAQPWAYAPIYSWNSGQEHEGLAKADIDGDGQIDIVGGGRWFTHNGGTQYTPHIIDDDQRFTRVAVGQLKSGGRPEVVFVAGDGKGQLTWYEWIGSAWRRHNLLWFKVDHGHSLAVSDVDGDGDLDIFCAEMRLHGKNADAKMWLFLGDGDGNFTRAVIAKGYGNHEARLGDLDGDGDLDILGKPYDWETPHVDVWLNNGTGLTLDRWRRHVVDTNKPWRSIFISAADMNGDGHPDMITGGWWYKNPGVSNGSWQRNLIGAPLNNMATVYDFDGDGDMDVLGTQGQGSEANSAFVWARNNGSGVFTILNNIEHGDGDFLQGVGVGQFQDDGPLEVILSWHVGGKGIQSLTVPAHPYSDFWTWRKLSDTSQDEALSVGDIDRDGDLDVLLGTKWLRNDGASWRLYTLHNGGGSPDRNRLADINGDGRLDAVVGFEAISKRGKLVWYEQGNSATSTWIEHVISTVIGPMSLDVADMNGNGALDVVVGEHNLKEPASANLYVFANKDGKGRSWSRHLIYTGDEHHDGTRLVDIDADQDLDIISIGWSHDRVLLYENQARMKKATTHR